MSRLAKGQASSSLNNNDDSSGGADNSGEDGVKRRVLRSRYLAVKNLISGIQSILSVSYEITCVCVVYVFF